MAPDEATVGVKALRAAFAIAKAARLDVDALAKRHGARLADLDAPDRRYSHAAWTDLWDDIERLSGDPGLGLHAAQALPMGHWDVVDYLIASSETVGEGLHKLACYFPLMSTAVDHELFVDSDECRIIRTHRPGVGRSRPASELVVASIVLRFQSLASSPWRPTRIDSAHGPSVPPEEYERLFGCPVRFDEKADVIVVGREVLDIPMKRPEAELNSVLERHARAMLAQTPNVRPGIHYRVQHTLFADLPSGPPSLGHTAKRLGMSTRTLQRRLTEAGFVYSELVEHTREVLARRYLADPAIGLGEVGFLVGFADASAFYKAFRRWTGQTPGAYRARLLRAR